MGFQIVDIDNQGYLTHLCIFRENVAFNGNGNQFKNSNVQIVPVGESGCKTILKKFAPALTSRLLDLSFLFEKMNHTGSPKLAVNLWIPAPNTGMTQVILVFRTKIGTLDLWMILTIFHLPPPSSSRQSAYFNIPERNGVQIAVRVMFFARPNIRTPRLIKYKCRPKMATSHLGSILIKRVNVKDGDLALFFHQI